MTRKPLVALAGRLDGVRPSATMAVAAEAARLRRVGEDIVDLSAGEPDFPTPAHVKAAARDAIGADFTRYTSSRGIPELGEAIAAWYRGEYGVDVERDEVLVTAGGKQALFNAVLALLDPGDEVVTHAPYWPTIPEQIRLAGGAPVIVPTLADEGFVPRGGALVAAMTARTRAVILNSPGNPTGALMTEADVALVADAAAARDIWVIADLCYERLIHDAVPHNLPGVLFERHRAGTVLAGSTSKTYAMTGWRCGWTIAPRVLTDAMNVVQGQTTSHVTSITQKAALAALEGPGESVERMRDEYRARRNQLHGWLTAHPAIQCIRPSGAFYLFPDVSALLSPHGVASADALARALVLEERVVVTPGEVFGTPGHVRLSYAASREQLREGATRILRFADGLRDASSGAAGSG